MCKFILATLPRATELRQLEASIPAVLRRRLVRLGPGEYAPAEMVAIEEVGNPFVAKQLPSGDRLVRLTRMPCDCWSDLGRRRNLGTPSKEIRRWLALIRLWIERGSANRIGLFIHFGDPGDAIVLRGPIVHEIAGVNVAHLELWDWDTIHEFVG